MSVTADDVYDLIADFEASRPRSKQKKLGPSDISTPCARRIGYGLLGVEPVASAGEVNLPAFIGSALHERMEQVLRHANTKAKRTIWDIEQNLTLDTGVVKIPCHVDAYNRDTYQIIDWKSTGPSAHARYVSQTPDNYLTQTDLYALAKVLSGHRVEHVSVMYFLRNPTSGRRSLHMDTRPWTGERADAAIKRYEAIIAATGAGTAVLPLLPTASDCRFCEWWSPGVNDLTTGCPGQPPTDPHSIPPWEPQEEEKAEAS